MRVLATWPVGRRRVARRPLGKMRSVRLLETCWKSCERCPASTWPPPLTSTPSCSSRRRLTVGEWCNLSLRISSFGKKPLERSESRKPSIPVTAFLPDYEKLMMHVILTSAQFALKDPATVSDLTQLRAHTTWLLGLMDALSTDDYAVCMVRQGQATRSDWKGRRACAWRRCLDLAQQARCSCTMHFRHASVCLPAPAQPRPSITYCASSMIRPLSRRF